MIDFYNVIAYLDDRIIIIRFGKINDGLILNGVVDKIRIMLTLL